MSNHILTWLQTLSEDQAYPLIQDLLKSMGYKRVSVTHGVQEYGRDLVFLEVDRLGREIWRGVQVKATTFTGSLTSDKGFRSILTQCEAALETPYSTADGKSVTVSELWLITTRPLSESAKASAQHRAGRLRNVFVLDGNHLSDLLTEYLPDLLNSGSRPLDDYLIRLMDYCDSVEQYISLRLKNRFSLSDIFVPPRVAIRLVSKRGVASLPRLTTVLRMDQLTDVLLPLAPLARQARMPALLHLELIEIFAQLMKISRAITQIEWSGDADSELLVEVPGQLVQDLLSLLGLHDDIDVEPETLKVNYSYRCAIDLESLQKIEKEIMCLDFDEVRVLRDSARLRDSLFTAHNPIYQRPRGEIKFAREQFFASLRAAYNTSLNPKDRMAQIAAQVARFVLTTDGVPLRVTEQMGDSIKRLRAVIDSFHAKIVYRLWTLCSALVAPIEAMKETNQLDNSCLSALVELEQLTRFIEEYYGRVEDIDELVLDAFSLCTAVPKVLLSGELGMGKTTLLKRVAAVQASEAKVHGGGRLPVLCSLSTLPKGAEGELTRQILKMARGGFKSLENFADDNLFWLLDGFDEIQSTELRQAVLTWLIQSPHERRLLLSARPHAIPRYLPNILAAVMRPFSVDQIIQLITEFPWEAPNGAEALLAVLAAAPELRELSKTPLFLTLIIVLAQTYGAERLPKRREGLYRVILDLLLGEWDLSKGIRKQYEFDERDLRLKMLRKVAFWLYERNKRSFSRAEFFEALAAANPSRPLASDSALGFFSDLIRDCIVIPLSREDFGFFHFSIQEYLAAEDLRDDVYPERVFSAISQFSRTGWWEEVLVFYSGLKRDIKVIVEELHKKSVVVHEGNQLSPAFLRLMRRMLEVADFTDLNAIQPRGFIATVFAELKIDGEIDKWRRLARTKEDEF